MIFSLLPTTAIAQSRSTQARSSQSRSRDRLGLWEQTFNRLSDALQGECREGEHFTLSLVAEDSQFTRMNRSRVRQSGEVVDGAVKLTWIANQRTCYRDLPFTGSWEEDWATVKPAVAELRQEIEQLPEDPFIVLPKPVVGSDGKSDGNSRAVYEGDLLGRDQAIAELLRPVQSLDFVGIYAAGLSVRAQADSAGQRHWFATESFTLDYSLFDLKGQAVKGTFADRTWDSSAYQANIARAQRQLQLMDRPVKAVPKGQYRTYLAPAAMSELILMMSWSCLSEAAIRQGGSPMEQLRIGKRQLSSQFTLRENFSRGLVPQFNSDSEMAPDNLPLIERGQLVNTTINGRTAQEYDLVSNGASDSEDLRAAEVDAGTLAEADILKALDTGLYLSNLHYLNWSDRPAGRITGMTRYACFWVEQGEIVAPIHDLRFDDTLFNFWGDNLIALTDKPELVPAVDTYEHRDLGGTWTPGALIEDFTYTL